jgi:hypothetical protein
MDIENMESKTTCDLQLSKIVQAATHIINYHHVMSCPITLEFTSEFLTKLMFGFSNGDRSAKAKLVAISGASSAKPDLRICQKVWKCLE